MADQIVKELDAQITNSKNLSDELLVDLHWQKRLFSRIAEGRLVM